MTVDLVPEWTIGDVRLTSYPFGVDADSTVDVGEPEMVVEGVTTMLGDGDRQKVVRHGNRTYVLELYVEGPTLADLAQAEADLRRELRRSGSLLTHDPGDGFAPASVYEVQTASLTPQRLDDHESHLIRKFVLTLTCLPFAMSAEDTTFAALTIDSGTATTIDACTSTTGWSGSRSGAGGPALGIWTDGVGVVDLDNTVSSPETWTLTRTGSVDFTSTGYLVAQIRTVSPVNDYVTAYGSASASGDPLDMISMRLIESGWYEVVYRATGVVPALTFVHTSAPGETWQGLIVRDLYRTNEPPGQTARQVSRLLEIGGTERTTGSIEVATRDDSDLFVTFVHTSPASGARGAEGYSPPLRSWRVSGNGTPTPNAGAFSGATEPLNPAPFVAQVPNSALPDGPYFVAAFVKSDSLKASTVYWTVRTIADNGAGIDIVGSEERSASYAFTDNQWVLMPLGVVSLPVAQAANAVTRFEIQSDPTDTPVITLDDVYLFWAGEGCGLTVVNAAKSYLWLDTPSSSSRVPTCRTGDESDRTDAYHPGDALLVPGEHQLLPGLMRVWVATLGATATYPNVSATYRKRWHSNAAE